MNYDKIPEITKNDAVMLGELSVHCDIPWKCVDKAWIICMMQHPEVSIPASEPSEEKRFFKLAKEMGVIPIKEMGGKGRIWIRKPDEETCA